MTEVNTITRRGTIWSRLPDGWYYNRHHLYLPEKENSESLDVTQPLTQTEALAGVPVTPFSLFDRYIIITLMRNRQQLGLTGQRFESREMNGVAFNHMIFPEKILDKLNEFWKEKAKKRKPNQFDPETYLTRTHPASNLRSLFQEHNGVIVDLTLGKPDELRLSMITHAADSMFAAQQLKKAMGDDPSKKGTVILLDEIDAVSAAQITSMGLDIKTPIASILRDCLKVQSMLNGRHPPIHPPRGNGSAVYSLVILRILSVDVGTGGKATSSNYTILFGPPESVLTIRDEMRMEGAVAVYQVKHYASLIASAVSAIGGVQTVEKTLPWWKGDEHNKKITGLFVSSSVSEDGTVARNRYFFKCIELHSMTQYWGCNQFYSTITH